MGTGEVLAKIFFCFCGPKGSTCCIILSIWGFLMLSIMGIALRIQAVALYEDLSVSIDEHSDNFTEIQQNVTTAYNNASNACFVSAGLYFFFLSFSGVMIFVNYMRSRAIKNLKQK